MVLFVVIQVSMPLLHSPKEETVTPREEVNAHVDKMPAFAFFGERSEIARGASLAFPDGEDHEVDLAMRTGRALQQIYGKGLDAHDQISPEDLEAVMNAVAYVPLTDVARVNVRYILDYYWKYWARLPLL